MSQIQENTFSKKLYFSFVEQRNGKIFSPVIRSEKALDDGYRFSFSTILKHLFSLKYNEEKANLQDNSKEPIILAISYSELLAYASNATKVLKTEEYMQGDPLVLESFLFGMDIYANPKNYLIANVEAILPTLNQEKLEVSYFLPHIRIQPSKETIFFVGERDNFPLVKFPTSRRYQEAFYGESAIKAVKSTKGVVYEKRI